MKSEIHPPEADKFRILWLSGGGAFISKS